MKIISLGSGSKGNCMYVGLDGLNLLFDVGLSMKGINEKLIMSIGIDLEEIDLILITHQHSDHIKSYGAIGRKYPHITFILPKEIKEDIFKITAFIPAKLITVEGVRKGRVANITPFRLNHDVPCYGYVIQDNITKETYAHIADNGGVVNKDKVELLTGHTYYGIESNHDKNMQILDETRHEGLKRRVLGYYGHTDNATAMEFAMRVATPNTKGIMFHHISEDCNDIELAQNIHQELIKIWGKVTLFKNITIKYATQDDWVELV